MERTTKAGSYALALFALFWVCAIVGVDVLPSARVIDAKGQIVGKEVVVAQTTAVTAQAGLRVGDLLPLDALRYVRRFGPANSILQLPVRRGSQTLQLNVPRTLPLRTSSVFQDVLTDIGITFALLLAAYLGFRRPSIMIAALILFLGAGALSWPEFVVRFSALPDFAYVPFGSIMAVLCDWFPVMALASFAIRLPGGAPSKPQQTAIRVVDAIVILAFCTGVILFYTGLYQQSYIACTALSGVVVLLASLSALLLAPPAERGRTGIVFAGVMVGGVGYAANMVGLHLGEPYWLFTVYANVSVIVVSLSLAYAILRHRVFDVAFVLNRTIVYALTSAFLIVLLAALEFGAERYIDTMTRAEGIALQFLIALAVTVSAGVVHRRIDRAVDTVLFRTRHEQEEALRRFATTAQFYTGQQPLIRDTVDALTRFGRVEGAAVYLAAAEEMRCEASSFRGPAAAIDENDPGYVTLRAHRDELDTHDLRTAFPGARLYPMVLAGRLAGAIATGERESGEAMPPDIDEAIRRIAAAVVIALAAIESDRIREENIALRQRIGVQAL